MSRNEFEKLVSDKLSNIDNKNEAHYSVIKAMELVNENQNLVQAKIYSEILNNMVINCNRILINSIDDFITINKNYFNERPRTFDFTTRKIAYNFAFDLLLKQNTTKEIKDDLNKSKSAFELVLMTHGKQQGCYIATMAYGDYDHPQVLELRKFRDDFLSRTILGRNFIKLYYRYSPSLVQRLKSKQNINLIIRKGLDQFIKTIKK